MSSQESYLQASGYIFDLDSKIWIRSEYAGIPYSDGDEAELRIARIVDRASNITVFSPELRQQCTDWPSLYHLSATRANILRPFAATLTGDILEIGAGCGAITRYLGESGANILALEGSPRRAAIVRSRTRDLENVTVLAEKFDQFECDHQFDLITLIGVLEYANLFTAGHNPPLVMLQRVQSLLKPSGRLILAIENQFGLKYFAGAPEDHIGQPMYGIEGRYTRDQPQTFGRTVLVGLLEDAGFSAIEFLAPFPDYKLPVSILTTEGINHKQFDGSALAWQSIRRDPQLPANRNFATELAWPGIFKNRLAADMSNSFLIAASPSERQIIEPGMLGYHYSTDRISQYCKEAVFQSVNKNEITINYRALENGHDNEEKNKGFIRFECPIAATYTTGVLLWFELIKILAKDWSILEIGAFIQRYVNLLSIIANQKGISVDRLNLADKLPGEFFDITPQNIILDHAGRPVVIDTEWVLEREIELGWLLVRSLLWGVHPSQSMGRYSKAFIYSRRTFIESALAAAGFPLKDSDFIRFIHLEADVQYQVTGQSSREFLESWVEQPLEQPDSHNSEKILQQLKTVSLRIDERYAQIQKLQSETISLNKQINERSTQIEELQFDKVAISRQIGERFEQIERWQSETISLNKQITGQFAEIEKWQSDIVGLNRQVSEQSTQIERLRSEIADIYASNSWRLTHPIRAVKLRLIRLCKNSGYDRAKTIGQFGPSRRLRLIYRNLPLPGYVKQWLKEAYLATVTGRGNSNRIMIKPNPNGESLPTVVSDTQEVSSNTSRILVVDYRIPTPDQDSGSVRMEAILRLLQEMGLQVTFVSDTNHHLPDYRAALEKKGIEVIEGFEAARDHLETSGIKYQLAFLSRPEVAFRYLPYVRAYAIYSKIIYDTVDLHWVRFEREMQITNNQALLEVSINFRRTELFNTASADLTLAVTNEERSRLLLEKPNVPIAVLPNIHEIYPPKTPFKNRRGIFFIGGFWHQPNVDAVIFFVKNILPPIIERIPDLVFYVIGSNMPDSIASLQSPNVQPLGFVSDVASYFESCRVFVAPLRYGAGMKGKVGQSMSHGLPVVTSTIGAEGMGSVHEKHLLIADEPQDFANAVVRLYQDELLWRKLSNSALSYLEENYSYAAARERLSHILADFKEELTTDNTGPNVENETSISPGNASIDSKQLQKVSV